MLLLLRTRENNTLKKTLHFLLWFLFLFKVTLSIEILLTPVISSTDVSQEGGDRFKIYHQLLPIVNTGYPLKKASTNHFKLVENKSSALHSQFD